ncbi:hypothetical protein ACIGW8_38340 [Streptomyces sioyaensis]|uniref:hypothetical protein n=1 Tax=Streptomyces sioyaensis TaxID=67364 RepID=UPI0037D33A35
MAVGGDIRARSGWFVAIPVHISGIIERAHVVATPERLLPQRILLIQWRRKRSGNVFRSWITDLPANTPHAVLVRHVTSRWCIETDYREMEQALVLGDYEGIAVHRLNRVRRTDHSAGGSRPGSRWSGRWC